MRIFWVIGAALAGRKAFGIPGAVLGGGLGIVFDALFPPLKEARRSASRRSAPVSAEAQRYPEEAIIDALQEAQGERAEVEMEKFVAAVSGDSKTLRQGDSGH